MSASVLPFEAGPTGTKNACRHWAVFLGVIYGSAVLSGLFGIRTGDEAHVFDIFGGASIGTKTALSLWTSRSLLLLLTLISWSFIWLHWKGRDISRAKQQFRIAVLAPVLALIASGVGGERVSIPPPIVAWMGVLLAVTVLPGISRDKWMSLNIIFIRTIGILSFLAWLLFPSWAMVPLGEGPFGGDGVRLAGICTHPNTFGPLLVIGMLFELARFRNGAIFFILLEAFLLILTENKTGIASFVLLAPPLAIFRHGDRWSMSVRAVVLVFSWMLLISIAFVVQQLLDTSRLNSGSIQTLTGRTEVWGEVVDVWKRNPVFGYGPRLWDQGMQASAESRLGWTVRHSHSQYVEMLGLAGIVGCAAMCSFIFVLARNALLVRVRWLGFSIALIFVFLIGGVSEPWFGPYILTAFPWLVIVVAAVWGDSFGFLDDSLVKREQER